MHLVALASANEATTAIAAHADDPELAFIAGGIDLIGLMKDRVHQPGLPPLTTRSQSMNRFDGYRDSLPNARLTLQKVACWK